MRPPPGWHEARLEDEPGPIFLHQFVPGDRPLQTLPQADVPLRRGGLAGHTARAGSEAQQSTVAVTDAPVVLVLHHQAQPVVPPLDGLGIVGAGSERLGHSHQGRIYDPLVAPRAESPLEAQRGNSIGELRVLDALVTGARGDVDGIEDAQPTTPTAHALRSHTCRRRPSIRLCRLTILIHLPIAVVVLVVVADFLAARHAAVVPAIHIAANATITTVLVHFAIAIIVNSIAESALALRAGICTWWRHRSRPPNCQRKTEQDQDF